MEPEQVSAQYLKQSLEENPVDMDRFAADVGVAPEYLAKVLDGEEVTSATVLQHWATILGKSQPHA